MYNAALQKLRTMEYARTATPRRGSTYAAYYPFGLAINGLSWQLVNENTPDKNPYLYNGKEPHTELNMNLHDYGARYYDAAVGRWWSIDNLAEKYNYISPYVYGLNNPISVIDPDGNDPITASLLLIAGVKAAIGIAIDLTLQVSYNYATNGNDLGKAFGNVDYTSVAASGLTGALSIPGIKPLTSLIGISATIVLDASTDISYKDGVKSVVLTGEKNKSGKAAGVDLLGGALGNVTGGITKSAGSVKKDLITVASETPGNIIQSSFIGSSSPAIQIGKKAATDGEGKNVTQKSSNTQGTTRTKLHESVLESN